MINRLFILGILVGLHSFIQLVSGLQLVASGSRKQRKSGDQQGQHTHASIHVVSVLPRKEMLGALS